MTDTTLPFPVSARNSHGPLRLEAEQVRMIEDALTSVGEYGEVRLVVEKGKLRFLVLQKSLDVLKEGAARLLK